MKRIFTLVVAFAIASLSIVVMAEAAKSGSDKLPLQAVSRAYALRVYDDGWGTNLTQTELVSFDVDNPNEMSVEHKFDKKMVRAAAYIDGTYYMMESDDGYVAYRFSTYNIGTKQYNVVKEYKTSDLENALMLQCMTYDATTKKIYAYAFDIRNSSGEGEDLDIPFELFSIDPATGKATMIGENKTKQILALAADASGYLYGLDTEGTLWSVNKSKGTLSYEEGYAPLQPKSLQSMAFDTKNNLLYWAGFTQTNNLGNGFFGKFKFSEDEGWMYSKVGDFTTNSEFIGLWIDSDPLPKGSPASVINLTMTPASEGALQATLSWINPTYDNAGNNLIGSFSVKIYSDGKLVQTVENQNAGKSGSAVVTETTSGVKNYTVVASNTFGDGRTSYVEGFVGRDTPGKVSNIKVVKDSARQLTVSWEAPAKGSNEGWYDASTVKYDVKRLPDNLTVATGLTATTYTDGNIDNMAGYSYSIIPSNADGVGTASESDCEFAGNPLQMPFSCNFTTDALVRLWKIFDADADGQTWYATKNNVESFMKYFPDQELSPELKSNDWFTSAPMHFEAGKTYSLSYWVRSQGPLFPVNYNVTLGKDAAPESQTTILSSVEGFDNQSMEQKYTTITVPETGDYSIGFQALNRVSLHIKDVVIEQRNAVELSAESISGSGAPIVGEESQYVVSVKNNGFEAQNGFNVQLLDASDNVLASNSSESIEPFATKDVVVNWTPEKAGKMKVRARVVANGDADATNDETEAMNVNVLEGGRWLDLAQYRAVANGVTPFNVTKKYSLAQTIYDADSIAEKSASIKGLMFYYNATADVEDFPVKIYLANTDKKNFTDKVAVAEDQFTLVYDGKISVPKDQTSTVVLFDKPFEYTGSHLAMMTRGNAGKLLSGIYFMSQYMTTDKDKHLWYDFNTTQEVPFPTKVLRTTVDRATVSLFIANQSSGIADVNAADGIDVTMQGNVLHVDGEYDVLRIYSVNGGLVAENAQLANVDMNQYQAGVYILEFVKNGVKTVKRVIVK